MEHWKILEVINNYAHIMSPSMDLNDTSVFKNFKDQRALRYGLKEIEFQLKLNGHQGWYSWTLTSRPHVMRLFARVNAKPYDLIPSKDPSQDIICFKKEI